MPADGEPDRASALARDMANTFHNSNPAYSFKRRCVSLFSFGVVCCCILLTSISVGNDLRIPSSTVGLPVELNDVVLPGSEIEPVPISDESPVVIRVDAVYPHGTDHRYDLVVSALEPGIFDLRDYLRRKDGASAGALPLLKFTVESLLPPGQVEPHRPMASRLPWLGGYRLLLIASGILWAGVMAWLLWPRRASNRADESDDDLAPTSFAERLEPLVCKAKSGEASPAELAELERAVVEFWRRRIGFEDVPPTEVVSRLRIHPEAAPLLLQLEDWLHRPEGGKRDVDVSELLTPYADAPAILPDNESALAGGTAQ